MKHLITTLLTLIVIISCSKKEPNNFKTIDYSLYFGEKKAGYLTSSQLTDGSYQFIFEYTDRGRGPYLEETILLDENGFPRSIQILGHNYLKDTVSEVFSSNGKVAKWQSRSENENKEIDQPAYYVGVNSTFGNTELLIRNMLNNSKKTIDLYPSGKVTISDIEKITINDTLNLQLIEVTGFSFSPYYLWFDTDNRLFAAPSSWLSMIRNGYESLSPQLYNLQTKKEKEYYLKTAQENTQTPNGRVAITHTNIFDSNTGEIIKDQHIIFNGNKIEQILDGSQELPEVSQIIEGANHTLMPGLFDMHTHLDRSEGILNLAAGVTSVRDLANSFELPEVKNDFNQNTVLGPRILIMSGFIDQAGPYAGPSGKIVSSLEEGLEAIDYYKENNYHQIKLYSSIDPTWVKPLADRAHELGLRVSGHIPAYMHAEQAVLDGYNEIQHINMIALNFMPDTIDTRTPLRFSMIGELAHTIDTEGEEFQSFISLLKTKNIVVDPTVGIFERMLTSKVGEPNPQFVEILDRLPIQIRRGFYSGGLPIPEEKELQYKQSYDKLLEMIKALYDGGVTIVPGTDAMSGFALHKELENYVRAGIPESEVLKMATIRSAEVTGYGDQLGSIEEGKLADLILVEGNPLENISDIRRVVLTIKDGKIYNPEKMYKSIGVKHFN
ncbi:amidohydrolase family protein [Mangrovivirga sp. M17]|uniref:Amidohydrolase family protein n=1 Tax=Mangrovivirga halotolerans TaxID=2993936 RepID=A0ABT3RVM3_9BACT|nr:amidohydrolase family protein [Mangrovivirga halotolerans]MCX2745596.1 amidohydrolase family protein [Mangrovivirga halotolerans]